MPELNWKYGYLLALFSILLVVLGLIVFFRKKSGFKQFFMKLFLTSSVQVAIDTDW